MYAEEVEVSAEATGYTLTVNSESGNRFTISNEEGTVAFRCTEAGVGGCPPSGDWGAS